MRRTCDSPLTRRPASDRPASWHVHPAGVRVGVIVERSRLGLTGGNKAPERPSHIAAQKSRMQSAVERLLHE
jgi:hypothetical protein